MKNNKKSKKRKQITALLLATLLVFQNVEIGVANIVDGDDLIDVIVEAVEESEIVQIEETDTELEKETDDFDEIDKKEWKEELQETTVEEMDTEIEDERGEGFDKIDELELKERFTDEVKILLDKDMETKEEDIIIKADLSGELISGSCGENVTYVLDNEGVLTISGSGDMRNYRNHNSGYTYTPWESEYHLDIKKIIIENNITSIGTCAFISCSNLTKVEIPLSVINIGGGAFSGCSSLEKVKIPFGIASIESSVFSNCSNLTEVDIPSSITSIDKSAFSGCSSLTKVDIPSSVISIGGWAFSRCSSLTSIELPFGITKIEKCTFLNCSSLTNVKIPTSVVSIESNAFSGCSKLSMIKILNPDCSIYDSDNTIPGNTIIYGYTNSTAQSYAEKYNRKFVSLDDIPEIPDDNNIISDFKIDETKDIAFADKTIFTIRGILDISDSVEVSNEILTSEIENIKWTSSDQSIVKDSDISCIGENSSDYRKSDLEISFIPQKGGNVIITGTTSNGLISFCELSIILVEFSPGNGSWIKDSVDGKFILTIKTDSKIGLSGNPEGYMRVVVPWGSYNIYGDGEATGPASVKKDSAGKQGIFITEDEHAITFQMPNLNRGEVSIQFSEDFLKINDKSYETKPILDDSGIIQLWEFSIEPDSEVGFSFVNAGKLIEKDTFEKLFPKSQANKIYKEHKNAGEGGLCFGMSLIAAGLSYGTFPKLSDFEMDAKTTWDLEKNTNSSSLNVSLIELLQIGQIAQWLPAVNSAIMEENASKGEAKNPANIKKLVDASIAFVNSGNNPVIIGITTNDLNATEHVQHALVVLDVKETRDSTILILYDSNVPGVNSRLELYKKGENYTGEWDYIDFYERSYKSCDIEGTFITFCQPLETFKQVYNSADKKNYNQYLLTSDKNVKISADSHAVKLSYEFDVGEKNKQLEENEKNEMYWVESDIPLILDTDGVNASFDITGNTTSILFENINSAKTEIVSLEDNFSIITENNNNNSRITYDFYIDDKIIRTEFQLDPESKNLTISNKGSNIYLKGINEISIIQGEGYINDEDEFVSKNRIASSYDTLNTDKEYSVQILESLDKIVLKDDKGNIIPVSEKEIEEISYMISYNLNGGTLHENINPTKYTSTTETFTLNNPIREGYTFIGWIGSNGTAPQKNVTIEKGTTGNLSYTANWKRNTSSNNSSDFDDDSSSDDNNDDYNLIPINTVISSTGKWIQEQIGWWYRNADGSYPANKWQFINDKWYFFNKAGYMVTGWILSNNKWYYLDTDGAMLEDNWIFYKDHWYFLKSGNGDMAIGWILWKNKWYYLNENGDMAVNCITPDGYQVDSNGEWIIR